MPQFAYQARNARGELVKGVLEGPSSGAVADQLFNIGITPVHIEQTQAEPGGRGSFLQMRIGEQKVELGDLMLFSRQMYTLLKAGVPIVRGLAGLQESVPKCARASSRGTSSHTACGSIRKCLLTS